MAYTDLSSDFGSGTTIPSSIIQALQNNYKSFVYQESGAPILDIIRYGSYVGNGSTSNYISGIGFTSSLVSIIATNVSFSTSGYPNFIFCQKKNDGTKVSFSNEIYISSNSIINIGSDGFTVSDSGNDSCPNANGITYQYICWK